MVATGGERRKDQGEESPVPIALLCYAALTGGVLWFGGRSHVRMPLPLRGPRTRARCLMARGRSGLAGMGWSFR